MGQPENKVPYLKFFLVHFLKEMYILASDFGLPFCMYHISNHCTAKGKLLSLEGEHRVEITS